MTALFIIKFGSDRIKTVGRVAFWNFHPHVWVSECYQSLTAHQHQKGHTVSKQVITIATSIQVTTV